MRNKKIITALITGILCVGSCVPVFAGTWTQNKAKDWYYIKDNGAYAQKGEWIVDNGKTYFFDSPNTVSDKGVMATYNHKCNGVYYCFNPDGSLCSSGWNRAEEFRNSLCLVDKENKIVTSRFFMVNGIIYHPDSKGLIYASSSEKPYSVNISGDPKHRRFGWMMNGVLVNKDGSPYPVDGELLKGETIPVYSSDGTYIKTIQN